MSAKNRNSKRRTVRRLLRIESMESRQLLAADFFKHNFDMPEDVNGDQYVSAIDALAIVNELNSHSGIRSIAAGESAPTKMFLDVSGDGFVSPVDALGVVNRLNSKAPTTVTPASGSTTTTNTSDNDEAAESSELAEVSEVDQQGEHEGQFGDQNDANELPDAETNDDGVGTTPPVTTPPKTTPPVTTPVATTPVASTPVTNTSTPVTTTPVATTPVATTPTKTATTVAKTTTPTVPTTTTKSGTTTPTSQTNFDDDDASEGNEASESAETVTQRLVSTLQGTGAETARVVFESGTENGAAQRELEVRVRNSTPSSTLDVVINGVKVGSVTTDARGNGSLQLATVRNGTSELPLPADFPAVAAAATVQIGTTMSGTLAVPTNSNSYVNHEDDGENEHEDDGDRDDHDGDSSSETGETQFTSILAGTSSQLGYVQFESESHRDMLKSELGISVNSLTPNASLDVIIDGITVGQIATDANGHGDLDLSSLPHETNELPLPANFPAIAAGSTIQIGTELSGTFTASPNNPTLTTTSTPAALALQPQRLPSIGQGNSHHRSRHR